MDNFDFWTVACAICHADQKHRSETGELTEPSLRMLCKLLKCLTPLWAHFASALSFFNHFVQSGRLEHDAKKSARVFG